MKITMCQPDDFHVHFRSGRMLDVVAGYTAAFYGRAIAMPNLHPNPVLDAAGVRAYEREIRARTDRYHRYHRFRPLMTIQVTEGTTPQTVYQASRAGAVAGKVYPFGVTTNSQNGVRDYGALDAALQAMSESGMRALFHGEHPGEGLYCLDREVEFVTSVLPGILRRHPTLKVVLEHVTTAAAVELVRSWPTDNLAATITVHHLFLTTDDILGGRQDERGSKLQPHNFCKPVAKRESDRQALLAAATSGHPRFFLGTDSAPHGFAAKECAYGCAGVFMPGDVALPLLVEIFGSDEAAVARLERFASFNGAAFYGLPPNHGTITLEDGRPWTVQDLYGVVVPFWAGRELRWRVFSVNR